MRDETAGTDRRSLLQGLALAALPSAVGAQEIDPSAPEAQLEANLLTRLGLPVAINGQMAGLFVVDTGAGRTVLATETAQRLELKPSAPVLVHGVTSAQVIPTVRVDRLALARRRFFDLDTPMVPQSALKADGLLGLDVLSHFRVTIDVQARTVDLEPPGGSVDLGGGVSAMRGRAPQRRRPARRGRFGQLILGSAEVDGRQCDVFIDTGAQYSIGNLALLNALGHSGPSQRQTVFGVTGQMLSAGVGAVNQLTLGGQHLGPTRLLFADLHAFEILDLMDRPALLAGADLIYRFRQVVLDFDRSEISFSGLRRIRPA